MDAIYFICSQTGIAQADLGAPFKRFSFFFFFFFMILLFRSSILLSITLSSFCYNKRQVIPQNPPPPPPPQAINNDWSSVHFHYAPNTYSHCTKDSYRTYTICDVPLWRSVQHNFTPLQIKHQKNAVTLLVNKTSSVWFSRRSKHFPV